MLGQMLGDGITVVREYDTGVPPVEAHAAELNIDSRPGRTILRVQLPPRALAP